MQISLDAELMSLEELDAYLMSDQAPEDCMLMPELHGYLTAVAIGPEAIMPSEWLPVVWGGEEPEFSSLEEMKRVIGTILAHYNDILETLADETRVFEPVVYISKATNEPILEDWALGFARGMRLRPSGWQTLINSDEVVHVAPITAFTFDPAEHPDLTSEHVEAQKRIRDHADQMLPECLINIQRFFQRTRQHFEGGSKLGRNDPCFCGSGKKFKKCCGASRR